MAKRDIYNRYTGKKNQDTSRLVAFVVILLVIAAITIIALLSIQIRNMMATRQISFGFGNSEQSAQAPQQTPPPHPSAEPQAESTQTPEAQVLPTEPYNLNAIYNLLLNIDLGEGKVSCVQETTFTNTTGQELEEIAFRIYPNIFTSPDTLPIDDEKAFPEGLKPSEGIELSSVALDGKHADSLFKDDRKTTLTITPATPILPDETHMINMAYTIDIPKGSYKLSRTSSQMQLSYSYAKLAEFKEGMWQVSTIHTSGSPWDSEVAQFNAAVEVDESLTVASTGVTTSIGAPNAEGRVTHYIKAENARDFALGLARKASTKTSESGKIRAVAHSDRYAELIIAHAEPILSAFEDWFGVPLNENIDLFETDLSENASAQTGLIFLDTKLLKDESTLDQYLSAALAAQYFGCAIEGDHSFHRSLALFCSTEYLNEKNGVNPVLSDSSSEVSEEDKTVLNLLASRKKLGTIAFDQGLQNYVKENFNKTGGAAEFIAAFNNDENITEAVNHYTIVK